MRVTDLTPRQLAWEGFEIELRIAARPRHRSDVDDKFDARFPKEIDELFEGPGRMTYGEEDIRDSSS